MADIDPDTLLEWLTMGCGDERDMQVIALEQLCMLLLMSDNVDRCFESCPPRSFLPALCHIFMDEGAPDSILEVTARAITYYLDVSAECSRRIVTVDGAVKALCTRLVVVDISSRASKDLAEQCVKVLELMCTREANAIYEAGGLNCMLTFIREHGSQIHKDTLHSAMSVVARLCSKMEPTDETLEHCMDSLSKLLQHEDTYVADVALKCFACLADRFTRRGVDPAPLAKHGLTEELLKKLVSSALACNLNASTNLNASMSESRSSSGNVSIIVSVLSMLCRGSATVTHDLLRSSLPNAIETAMQGDERCVLDTMRLVDLLLIILFEGREALPKSVFTTTRGTLSASRTPKTDSSGEKSHRQLIDCIRSKDTDALVTAVASSAFDVNFMDDVGQTLLNWASAFGTLEMVEFLCERGSDVNRGQRSSSLHYAACFGRPAVAKVLLKYGANPELRDEDGKTPLDKARERTDEGHKEVVKILQSPGEWMALALENSNKQNENKEDDTKESGEKENDAEEIATDVVKGDPEMAPVYVKHLVPVFANTYQGSLLQSVKKSTLSILKKIIHYMPSTMMKNLISNHLASQLVEVVAVALTSEEDEHGQLSAFHCVQDLMLKAGDMFLIHFIRLGVLQRITDMVNDSGDLVAVADDQIIQGNAPEILKDGSSQDASKVTPGCPYHWHDWCIVRGRDCLYIWSDFCAIELSNGSNGWFRFVLDGKLATMYSSGSPEGGSSSSESRSEFLDKLQRARSAVPADAISQSILSSPSNRPITVENWTLKCRSENQLAIINSDGQQATVLKEDLPGFFFESNRGTKHTFTAETSLGADFSYSWSGKAGKKYQSKKDQLRQDLCTFARNLYQKYFKDADLTPHGSMAILHKISETLNSCTHSDGLCSGEKKELVLSALQELRELILSEEMLSSYEIQKSGLVDALNNCLNKAVTLLSQSSISHLPRDEPYVSEKFKEVFQNSAETEESSPAILKLVHKLVTVLESTEKLPVLTYEGLGGGSGLQVLLRRLRFKLERDSSSSTFIDRSGKCIKMEPLTTVSEVKKYLLKTVAKQWYDYERSTFKFISCFQDENAQPIEFTYESDFDENGVLYWIGTNAKSVQEWTNPARQHIVNVMSSEGRSLPYGKLEDVINRDSQAVNCHTNDDKTAWFSIDLGVYVIPIKYTLRHSRGYGRSALRNWLFQVSNDGVTWVTLKQHDNDDSLNEPSSVASWDIPTEAVSNESKGWHIVRIQQNGVNASGQTYYLSVSGFEVYGKVTGVLPNLEVVQSLDMDSAQRRQRRVYRSQILRHMALASKEGNELKLFGHHGKKVLVNSQKSDKAGWVNVAWPQVSSSDDAKTNTDADCNFKVVDISDPEVQAAMYEVEKKEKNKTNLSNSHQSTLDNALRQVVMSFGKKKNKTDEDTSKSFDKDNVKLNVDKENKSNNNNADAHKSLDSCSGSRIDLANLQFLMAVEDLLDSPSSDLVASALAEAASMHVDQLRLATRSFRSSLLETSKSRPTPSAQGSRESQSPASELNTNPLLESHYNNTVLSASETVESKTVSESTPDKDSSAKEFDMNDIQKAMESSMSSVLDSMRQNEAESYNEDDDNDNDDDDEDDDDFDTNDVEENNFINDQESPMEPNVISIIHSLNDCCSSDDECRFDDKNDINESVVEAQIQITSNDTEIQNFDSKADDKIIEMTDQQENKREADVTEKTTSNGLSEFLESADTIEKADDMHVMEEIFENKFETERLQSELDCIKNEISSMKNEVEKIEIHVEAMENRVEKITTNLDSFNDEAHLLAEEVKNIASRQDFLVEEETECSLAKYNGEDTPNQRENQSSNLITLVDNTANNDDNEKNKVNENNETENKELLSLEFEEMLETTELDQAEDDAKESDEPQSGEQTPKGKSDSDGELKQDVGPEDETNMIKDDCESVEDMDMDDEDDDDEEDEDFDDIENDGTDENDEEMFSSSHVQQERHYDHQRRMWDDNLILKCQHTALVPAFDPRPGRTNIQQTQDIQIPNEEHLPKKPHKKDEQDIYLFLRGIPFPGAKEIELPLDKEDASIFSFVQSLVLHGASNGVNSKTDRLRRVWEPTYTIIYKSSKSRPVIESQNVQPVETDVIRWSVAYVKEHLGSKLLPKSELISYLQENNTDDFLKKWKLIGSAKVCRRQRNCSVLISSYKEFAKIKMEKAMNEPQQKEKTVKINAPMLTSTDDIEPIQQVLDVLKALFRLSEDNLSKDDSTFSIPPEDFLSKKLTNKLMQQIQDPLSLASGSLPLWCEYLVINYPTIFPFETRQTFFRATAFGCSRSIVWLQNMQDANLERARGHPTRRLETTEFRIGRLKHERVTVPRGENLLENAVRLMDFHAERKSVLEIEFENEEGTGLGPSLEFYALVAMAIQRNCLRMWVSMDVLDDKDDSRREELSTYSRHPNGLFPAPLPQDAIEMKETCKMFSFLGIFLAKCIQDNRLVDLPLSEPLFKMLCASKGKYSKLLRTLSHTSESLRDDLTTSESEDEDDTKTVDNVFEASLSTSVEKLDSHYFSDVLTNNDFELIHPNKAKFLRCLNNYIEKRHVIMDDQSLSELEKKNQLDDLLFTTEHGHECRLEDLGLTFQYIPSSTTYGFDAVELLPNGGEKMLCGENAEEYVSSLIDFTMHKGIARQLEAFRAGFNRVFPMEKLHAFKAHEIRLMLCGDQAPSWTYDELVQYTEPKYGYHKDSPGFVRLLNVLVEMSGDERKAFLQFATGCSSLPPGGLANLHPRLTVVKKEDEGDGSYPSVNTCVHYLKLPEYSSEVVLRDRLLAATNEKGFHLN